MPKVAIVYRLTAEGYLMRSDAVPRLSPLRGWSPFWLGIQGLTPLATTCRPSGTRLLFLLLVCPFIVFGVAASAAEPAGQYAVLIGVDQYHHAPPLRFAVSDTLRRSQTLRRYGGYNSADMLQLVDAAADPALHPTRANLLEELPRWLSKAGANDRVLIAFSGHAFRADDGELYLAAQDTDPKDPLTSGVAVSWLREQLASCRAGSKLLLLDTRQTRPEQAAQVAPGISAAELAQPLSNVPGLTVLTASDAGQPSLVWTDRRQSLFAYWLVEALKGHADADRDGLVTIEELSAYVQRHVAAVAKQRLSAEQQPRRIGLPADDDRAAVVVRLQPQSLKRVLADMADQLALRMELGDHQRLGVLEFTSEAGSGEVLGGQFGVLGRYCGAELQQLLLARGVGQFEVADRRRMDNALSELEFETRQLGSEAALKELGRRAGQLPVVAVGMLADRQGRTLTMRCQLLRTDGSGLAGETVALAALNDSEWAMLGRSVNVEPADYPAPLDSQATQVADIGRIDQRAETGHPLADPEFPLRVRIMLGAQERKGVFRGGQLLVPLERGEVYGIQVENRTEQGVFLRLLVDGLNTLPERVLSKGVNVEAAPRRVLAAAQPVNLAEARAWRLEPRPADRPGRLYQVRGFFSQVGEQAKYNEFRVVDARDSQAARIGFADQAGLITAAFYRPVPKPAAHGRGGLGTELGDEYQTQTDLYTGDTIPGPLMAVVHLRYVSK